uniref:hypothetical protein n=1 Tax=Agrococcus baldri TaxID=153730 RepID=UPI00296FC75F|nr:hypothetical protein [Agrococcus baldri]
MDIVYGDLDALAERDPERESANLAIKRAGQRWHAHLAQFPLGLAIDAAHRAAPA